jgi:tRNA (guanine10-N2)-dimethyltransferase
MNLYVLKHTEDETDLCRLEKKCLFNVVSEEKYFLIDNYINVDRSPYVKYCIKNITFGSSLDNLIEIIKKQNISFDNFKVKYLDIEGNTEFSRRHEIEGIIGYEINGYAKVGTPSIIIGVTQLEGKWILGEYLKNSAVWLEHTGRPQEYCNALTTRVSRAIVNIAAGDNMDVKIIDPCCGIGTIVIEALSMGFNIVGSDINEKIVRGALKNLEYFDLPEVIKVNNIHDIKEKFDIVFIDLPYGILSITNRLNQLEIIKSAKKIGNKVAIIGVEDILSDLVDLGFNIIEQCIIAKGNFKRNLYICESY